MLLGTAYYINVVVLYPARNGVIKDADIMGICYFSIFIMILKLLN